MTGLADVLFNQSRDAVIVKQFGGDEGAYKAVLAQLQERLPGTSEYEIIIGMKYGLLAWILK